MPSVDIYRERVAVLAANQRIGEEIKAIPKASGRPKKNSSPAERIINKDEATGILKDSRSRLGKLASISKPALRSIATKILCGRDSRQVATVENRTLVANGTP